MPFIRQQVEAYTTTSAYASALKMKLTGLKNFTLSLENTHNSNALKYKILVTNDPNGINGWYTKVDETTLAHNSADDVELNVLYEWVDLQVKDASSGNHATLNAYARAVT
jgi:hypothetical protein